MCSIGSCQTRFRVAKNQTRLAYEDKRDLYCIRVSVICLAVLGIYIYI